MPRELWKGAIRFGLVHIPVSLYPAEDRQELSFTMLDKRDLQPVGYKRYNKSTGDEVAFEDIVKGYEYEDGHFVTLDKDDFRRANVEATQTVDIVGFVDRHDIPPYYLESPYYLAPGKNGDKGYALLREVLDKQGKVAVATVVIRTRQHIAMVYARHNVLVLNTLRYESELRPTKGLEVPKDLKDAKVQPNEMKMAERLIDDMTIPWDPSRYHDTYRDDLLKMIEEKAAGHTRKMPKARAPKAEIVDFARLLERSLSQRKRGASVAANDEEAGESAPRRPKSAAHRKTASQRARRKPAAPRAHGGHRRAA
ncbi:MAG TPA: Ku protein [Usitatibacter sp.]|nr:Ku protein [Usitatibacter sp.]